MWSARGDVRQTLAHYAGLAAEVAAAIVIGFLITVMALMLNPPRALGEPVADRGTQAHERVVVTMPSSILCAAVLEPRTY